MPFRKAFHTVVAPADYAQAQNDVFAWMDKNAKAFKTLVNLLGITRKSFPANTKGTLLVPSDRVSHLQSDLVTSIQDTVDGRCRQQQPAGLHVQVVQIHTATCHFAGQPAGRNTQQLPSQHKRDAAGAE
jgi:hypothetical protein